MLIIFFENSGRTVLSRCQWLLYWAAPVTRCLRLRPACLTSSDHVFCVLPCPIWLFSYLPTFWYAQTTQWPRTSLFLPLASLRLFIAPAQQLEGWLVLNMSRLLRWLLDQECPTWWGSPESDHAQHLLSWDVHSLSYDRSQWTIFLPIFIPPFPVHGSVFLASILVDN